MTAPWPCDTCGAPGVRSFGTRSACAAHAAEFYRRLPGHVWCGVGIGLPTHAVDEDGFADLACVLCAATWRGAVFDVCGWCAKALADLREWQAELTLTPPDVETDDCSYEGVMAAWGERLARAVLAGVVTRGQAERAIAGTGSPRAA